MITAICEMADQASGIKDVRLIENTLQAMQDYEDYCDDQIMCGLGFCVYFFDTEKDMKGWSEDDGYEVMRISAHLEIEV